MDNQKCLSATAYIRNHRQDQSLWSQIFHQIQHLMGIQGDQWKAAFKTNLRLYEPTIIFFGLCNSPSTFQAMINDTIKDKIEE